MKNDDLEQLSDGELNEIFAVEVAELELTEVTVGRNKRRVKLVPSLISEDNPLPIVPPYCTDANAVLPWLEKCSAWRADQHGQGEPVYCEAQVPALGYAHALTFARAATIAIIRAKRVEKWS